MFKLIVALGNPGPDYAKTRHNVGWMFLDSLSELNSAIWKNKFKGEYSEINFKSEKVYFLKPQTFMNLSGASVQSAMAFYKLKSEQVIVIHDDLDLVPGQIKVKLGGGAGGHNGLKSIDQSIGNNYWRLRLGIGHPGDRHLVTPHVLSAFPSTDHEWLTTLLQALAEQFTHLVSEKPDVWVKRFTP